MESPPPPLPPPCYISQGSKKRVFPGSSSTCMEADDVVEIPPPVTTSSKLKSVKLKEKEVIFPEVIDVDMDDDYADVMVLDREVDTKRKGKDVISKLAPGSSSGINNGNDVQSSKTINDTGSHYFINDDFDADFLYGENEYVDMSHDDPLYDDQYSMIQAHLDSLDIPPGVEVSVPWFTSQEENKAKPAVASTSNHSNMPIDLDDEFPPLHFQSPSSIWPMEFEQSSDNSIFGENLISGGKMKASGQHWKSESPSSWSFKDPAHDWGTSTAARSSFSLPPKSSKDYLTSSSKMEMQDSYFHSADSMYSKSKRNHSMPEKTSSLNQFSYHVSSSKKHPGGGTSTGLASHIRKEFNNVPPGALNYKHLPSGTSTSLASDIGKKLYKSQPGLASHKYAWKGMPNSTVGHPFMSGSYSSGFAHPSGPLPFFPDNMAFDPWDMDPFVSQKSATTPENSSGSLSGNAKYGDPDQFLKNFEIFKKFDTVEDSTDHFYSKSGSSVRQPSKNWAKKIQEEWRILQNDLPDTIFVRVYESRMDILRAVIVGAEGTPYHDGLFFFDVFFPSNYPNAPPHVHYHSGGLRINPNLYNCGKVCLSLLNTWSGSQKEKWIPGVSTILQVLVSIQGLILNAKPYFNEPGYAGTSHTAAGQSSSLQYNERTFILSLKTMVYSIRRPPKYFEDLVAGHFYKYGRDILVACKAYMEGAQVGCLVKGGVQDVDEGDKTCSQHFKNSLAGFIKTLVDAFKEVGVKDCDEFLSLAQKANSTVPTTLMTGDYYYY